jgi:hypothetical protein
MLNRALRRQSKASKQMSKHLNICQFQIGKINSATIRTVLFWLDPENSKNRTPIIPTYQSLDRPHHPTKNQRFQPALIHKKIETARFQTAPRVCQLKKLDLASKLLDETSLSSSKMEGEIDAAARI